MTHSTPVPGARRPHDPVEEATSLDPDLPSDAELISAVRGGDLEAYGHLFERHVDSARRLARQLVNGPDSDDLVSDAFAKVLAVLQNGGGPDLAFRAYLLTALRRLHIDRIRSNAKLQSTDDMSAYDQGVPFTDTAVAGFENETAAKAFASLPERWQQVLWHTEVEGQKPADVAPLLGMTPNSVSALAYRAREGLREAFVSLHAQEAVEDACAVTRTTLGSYIRGGCSRRDASKVEAHLQSCRECTAIYLELSEVNSNLGAVLAPLLLGSAGAGYLAASHLGVAAAAQGTLSAAAGRARDWVTSPTGRVTGGVGVAAAAALAIALSLQGTSSPGSDAPPVAAPSPSTSAPAAPQPSTAPPTLPVTERPQITPVFAPTTVTPSPSTTPAAPTAAPVGVTLAPLAPIRLDASATSVTIDLGRGASHLDGTTLRVRSARIVGDIPHGEVRIAATATRLLARPASTLLIGATGVGSAARTSTASIVYTPDPSWRGTETIAYTVGDGLGHRASGTIEVTTPNRTVTAVDDRIELHAVYAAATAVTLPVLANDTDPNGDRLRLTSVTSAQGAGGSVALVGGTVRYTRPVWSPGQSADATDVFRYTVSDGHGSTASATVRVVVGLNPNNAPVVPAQQVSTHWSTPLTITPAATDADGDPITFTAGSADHGTVTLAGGVLTYTPTGAYVGTDTVSYTATDGKAVTTGTVTVTLTNAHPAAGDVTPVTISDTEDASVTVPVADADGDPLTFSDVTGATVSGRTLTWTPTFGVDSTHTIGYTVSDGVSSQQVSVPVTATRPSATVTVQSSHPNPTSSIEKHHFAILGLPSGRSVRVTLELAGGGTLDQDQAEGGTSCTTTSTTPVRVVECVVTSQSDFYHLDFNPTPGWSLSVTAVPIDFTGPTATWTPAP